MDMAGAAGAFSESEESSIAMDAPAGIAMAGSFAAAAMERGAMGAVVEKILFSAALALAAAAGDVLDAPLEINRWRTL